MEQERTKSDEKIERGVDALRAERGAAGDHRRLLATLTRPRRTGRIVAAAAGATCIASAAAILLIPRVSAAAELDKIGDAIASLPPRQEIHLVATHDGEYEVELELFVDNDEVVLHGKDQATQKWKNDRLTTEFEEYSTVQDSKAPEWSTKTFVLSDWIRRAVPSSVQRKMVKASEVLPQIADKQGIALDGKVLLQRVAFDVKLDKDRQGHVVFNVEPDTLRPVIVQAQIEGERAVNVVLGYKVQEIELELATGGETYDIDRQRQQVIDSFAAPLATTEVDGTKIMLHLAVVDHQGNLTLIYSGSEPLPIDFDRSRVIDGQAEGPTLALMPQSYEDGKLLPVPYKQLQVSLVSVRLQRPEDRLARVPLLVELGRVLADKPEPPRDVQVPVVVKGNLHWVKFPDVTFVRTGSTLQTLAPENVPFFVGGSIVQVGKALGGH